MATFLTCPTSSSLVQLKLSPSKSSGSSGSFASLPKLSPSNGCVRRYGHHSKFQGIRRKASSTLAVPQTEELQQCSRPTWTEFELGKSPIYWRTATGLAPASGDGLTLFYNPAATKLVPDERYGIAFNGGFNQPIMCGGEPRVMTKKNRGAADAPYFSIRIRVPKHAVNLIFSFTNGEDWDGPYKLEFQIPNRWKYMPMSFFNEGLTNELSAEGACEKAIFPDSNPILSCEIGNLYIKGGESCKLNLVEGCMDPDSPLFDPLATVDDGSCPIELEEE